MVGLYQYVCESNVYLSYFYFLQNSRHITYFITQTISNKVMQCNAKVNINIIINCITDSSNEQMIQNIKLLNSFQQKKHPSLKLNSFSNVGSSTDKLMFFHKYLLMFLLFIDFSIQSVEAGCAIIATQDIFINSTNYCTMKYCSFASVAICYQYSCQNGTESCSINFQSTSDVTCDVQCCKNINAPQNANISLSHTYCSTYHSNSESSSNTNTYNIVTITVFSVFGAVVALFIVIACCKRHQARRREAQDLHNNRNNNRGTLQALIPPIDLKDYKLDQQGPYLINIYNQCAICLEPNVNLRTHCNHYYHGSCLYEWFNKNPTNPCPLCMSVNFNPVKLYCKKCFAGDQLIIFNGNLRRTQIAAIDDHKCDLCKNNSKDDNLTFYDGSQYNGSKNEQKSIPKKNETQTIKKKKKNNDQEVIEEDDLSRTNKKMKPDQI